MHHITLHKQWIVKAPVSEAFRILTDFEHLPEHFPKVAQAVDVTKREENYLEMEATVKSFGRSFKVRMQTHILPGRGFTSDNDSYQFGTSGHEELLLSDCNEGTCIDYTYQVTIHKVWIRMVAVPLLRWYAMSAWEKAVIVPLRTMLEVR